MAWFLLIVAILSEVVGTLSLKASNGFTKLWPSIGVVVGYGFAFLLLAFALKKMDVGIAYAIWSGVGIIGAALGAYMVFDQAVTRLNLIGMGIIILGVVVMNLGGSAH